MKSFFVPLGTLVPLAFSLSIVQLQTSRQDPGCSVKIIGPAPEGKVAEMDQVRGTGAIPAWAYLWVFVHRKGLALWWPQGGGQAVITKGAWDVAATFGQDRDNGRQFEIAAVVVDRNTNEKLIRWIEKANETNQYPGMTLPSPIEECKLQEVTVRKE